MRYKSARSKACDIPVDVRRKVFKRDGGRCIFCGRNTGIPNAHFVARSQGGKGVEQNILTACPECHHRLDNTSDRERMKAFARQYLKRQYADWTEKKLIYDKWGFLNHGNE